LVYNGRISKTKQLLFYFITSLFSLRFPFLSMTDVDLTHTGTSTTGGDTEIDLYADVVENELDTETGDDYGANNEHIQQISNEGDLYDDVLTTQSSGTDFADITNTVHQNHVKLDQSGNHMNLGNNGGGKRVSLYVGQLTWVRTKENVDSIDDMFLYLVDDRYRFN